MDKIKVRTPRGFVSPLVKYRPSLVKRLGGSSKSSLVQREVIDLMGIEVELTYIENSALMIRAGAEGLFKCDDYGGFLIDEKDHILGVAIGDGVGSTPAAQIVACEVIRGTLEGMIGTLANNINEKTIAQLVSEVGKYSRLNQEVLCNMVKDVLHDPEKPSKYKPHIKEFLDDLSNESVLGATTLLGTILENLTLHTFWLGDGGYVVVGPEEVKNNQSIYSSSKAPEQIMCTPKGWFWTHPPHYIPIHSNSGDIVTFYTDGCLQGSYRTSEHIGNRLLELRRTYPEIREVGIALFCDLIGAPRIVMGDSSGQKKIEDDTTLTIIQISK
jgi:hypothetical protein